MKKFFLTGCFLLFTACILTHSQLALYYALLGLRLWFEKMIPALMPFMILSGIMIRLQLTEGFASLLYPLLHPLYRISGNAVYAMILGFFCGFPMGAKTVADLRNANLISRREAEFLLAFCNNIGPVYFVSFVLPLLHRRLVLPYLGGMYGLPLLYGLVLRFTLFKDLTGAGETACASDASRGSRHPYGPQSLLAETDAAITSALQSILSLGGYMVLFNLLNLPLHIVLGKTPLFLAPLFEISGGLSLLGDGLPLYALILLPFGGFSCIAQTYSCIKGTGLSISSYTGHKLVLTGITGLYYLGWFLLFQDSFLA